MFKRFKKIALMILALSVLAGCGEQSRVEKSTISIGKEGALTVTLIEDFSESYYDQEELKTMIDKEVAEYNTKAGSDKIAVAAFEAADGKVRLEQTYADASDYAKFNGCDFFWGTVAQAYALGTEVPDMTGVDDSGKISGSKILENSEYHIVITDETYDVVVPGKILYVSEGVKAEGKDTAVIEEETEKAFIVYQ